MRLKPISEIKADLGIEPNGKVQKYFTERCYQHMDKYVPKDTGNLRENVLVTSNSITYKSPYAHAQYVGFTQGPVKKYTTPGTGPYWDKRMVSAEINDIIKECQEYMKRGSK